MKKIIFEIIIIIACLTGFSIYSYAATDNSIELVPNTNSVETGSNVAIDVSINQINAIGSISFFINYDSNVFEKLKKDDIVINNSIKDVVNTFLFDEDTRRILINFDEDLNNIGMLCTINFKAKNNLDANTKKADFSLTNIILYNIDYDVYLLKKGQTEVVEINTIINNQLFLSSNLYKIGDVKEQEIDEYHLGDIYISKVSAKTTILDFINNNIQTNATEKKILDKDDNEITDTTKFIGTGMKILLTKGDDIIQLQIVVTGDVDGDGEVKANDLADTILKSISLIDLDDLQIKAIDMDEDDEITSADLADEIQLSLF